MQTLLTTIKNRLTANAVLPLVFLCYLFAGRAYATDYYVATDGSDANDGTSATTPFLTIQKASDVAVAGDVVYVKGGLYREMVDIKADGVTFQPYGGETVTLNGTDLLTTWTPESGATYKTTMAWDVDATFGTNQLFEDGTMIELARWPDQTSPDIVKPTNAFADNVVASGENYLITDADFNEPAGRWVGAQIWINLSRVGADGQGHTGTVVSHSGNTITVKLIRGLNFANVPWSVGKDSEYFLFNPTPAGVAASGGADALLSPGEWWKNGNDLYVKTRDGGQPGTTGTGRNVIEAKRRHFAFWSATTRAGYTIKGFTLFACAVITDIKAKENRGITEAAHDITIDGLTVKYVSHQTVMNGDFQKEHVAWSGIVVNGRNNTIRNCDIQYAATSGVSMQGFGIKALNNRIHDTNYMVSNSGALNIGWFSEDSEIGHNRIWNTTQQAIYFSEARNSNPAVKDAYRIHHNEIFDFMRRAGDSGAIDMAGSDLQWMRIDHNLIYNTLADASEGDQRFGIYLDFGSGPRHLIRATVDHNIIYNVTTPLLVNDGTEVDVFNNVLLTNNYGPNALHAIGNYNDQNGLNGKGVRIFNNILSHGPNLTGCCGNLSNADMVSNITNATGAVLNALFVDAARHNYQLKPTATQAIDKGISVGPYDENVQGPADLGAYEWGTFLTGPDTEAPSAVSGFQVSNKATTTLTISWQPSTDNVGVVYYQVYVNGQLRKNTEATSLALNGLVPSTTSVINIYALDGSGNRSPVGENFEAKTIQNDLFISKTTVAPVIDGTKEANWADPLLPLAKVVTTAPASPADLSGEWLSYWDDNNVYFYLDVNDNQSVVDSDGAWWQDDHIEIYIDADGTRPASYGEKQYQYALRRGSTALIKQGWKPASVLTGTQVANVEKPDGSGYRVEVKIPFLALGVTAEEYKLMGIEVQIGDDDDGGSEDTRMAWHSTTGNMHVNPSLMAVVQLKGSGANDTTPPSNPTGLKASGVVADGFTLSWAPATDDLSGVGSYEVFRNGYWFAATSTHSISLNALEAATTYAMTVRAKDRVGNLSAMSSVLNVTTPAASSEYILQAEDAALRGFAEVMTQSPGYTGTGYVGGYWNGFAATTFTVNNVPEAGTYSVRARYASGWGDRKMSIYVNGNKVVSFNFNNTGDWKVWNSKSALLPLRAGTNTITYQNDAGEGPITLDYIALFLTRSVTAPAAPTNLAASGVTADGFTLSWNAAAGSTVAGYNVFIDNVLSGTTASTTYNVSSLTAGTTYQVTVKTRDAAGSQSDPSVPLLVKTTPISTDRTDPVGSGIITARGGGNREKAFDNNADTQWVDEQATSWIQFRFNGSERYAVSRYTITSAAGDRKTAASDPRNWTLYGTNAANPTFPRDYVAVDARSSVAFGSRKQKQTFTLVNTTEYSAYRLQITANNGAKDIQVGEIELFAPPRLVPVTGVAITTQLNSLEIEKQQLFAATVSPSTAFQGVTWETSNPAVATVDNNGLVTAVAPGTVTLTARSQQDGTQTAARTIAVTPVAVTGVAIAAAPDFLEVEKQQLLSASVSPAKASQGIAWETSNPAVATVDNSGLVTGVAPGMVIITARSQQDSTKTAAKTIAVTAYAELEKWENIGGTAVSNIPVNTAPTRTTRIPTLESTATGDNYGVRIRGYIIPAATGTYYFSIASDDEGQFWLSTSDQPAALGTAPFIGIKGWTSPREWNKAVETNQRASRFLQGGTRYYFEALMKEGYGGDNLSVGCTTNSSYANMGVIGTGISGMVIAPYLPAGARVAANAKPANAAGAGGNVTVFPNPVTEGWFNLALDAATADQPLKVIITDLAGRKVRETTFTGNGGAHRIEAGHLAPGLYLVTTLSGEARWVHKIQVSN